MAALTALSAFYSSSARLPAPALTGWPEMHTHLSYNKTPNTHSCFLPHMPLSRNWSRKAVIGNCPVFGWSVEAAPPLLGSIKAALRWKTCDSVFCVRGAKRNLIHTSLTRCALKRLLSRRCARLQRETGARHVLRPTRLRFLSGPVSFQRGWEEQKTEEAIYCSKHFCFWETILFFLKLKPSNKVNGWWLWRE